MPPRASSPRTSGRAVRARATAGEARRTTVGPPAPLLAPHRLGLLAALFALGHALTAHAADPTVPATPPAADATSPVVKDAPTPDAPPQADDANDDNTNDAENPAAAAAADNTNDDDNTNDADNATAPIPKDAPAPDGSASGHLPRSRPDAPTTDDAEADNAGANSVEANDGGDTDSSSDPRPWAVGVSPSDQAHARQLYAEANDLLHEYLLDEAMDKYREALKHWDHPAIHYNLARAFDNLGQSLKAREHLQQALRFGSDAFPTREYAQVVNFARLLDQKLSVLIVVCDEPAVEVTLDGRQLFTAPGRVEQYLLPGEHQLIANKPGQAVVTQGIQLERGHQTTIHLETYTRWRPWKPWLVAGAGTATLLIGGFLQSRAANNFDRARDQFSEQCPDGCRDDEVPGLSALRRRATWQNRIGVGSMIAGGAVLLTGTVLVILNQSQQFKVDLGARELELVPALGPRRASVDVTLRF